MAASHPSWINSQLLHKPRQTMLPLLVGALASAVGPAIIAPNLSLATVPIGCPPSPPPVPQFAAVRTRASLATQHVLLPRAGTSAATRRTAARPTSRCSPSAAWS